MRTWLLFLALSLGTVGFVSSVDAQPPRRDDNKKIQKPKKDHRFEKDYGKKDHNPRAGVPELDPASFGAATVLVLGGAAVLVGRRRRLAF